MHYFNIQNLFYNKNKANYNITNFDKALKFCNTHVLADLKQLDQKVRECLEWSDTELLRVTIVLLKPNVGLKKKSSVNMMR